LVGATRRVARTEFGVKTRRQGHHSELRTKLLRTVCKWILPRFSPPGQDGKLSCPTFFLFFSAKKQACGPEARSFRGKNTGGERNPSEDRPMLPQTEAGLSGARTSASSVEPPGAPTTD